MERRELNTFIATRKRIYDFCEEVLAILDDDYDGILEGEDCYLDNIVFHKARFAFGSQWCEPNVKSLRVGYLKSFVSFYTYL